MELDAWDMAFPQLAAARTVPESGPHRHVFTSAELERLSAYRDAVRAGFFNEGRDANSGGCQYRAGRPRGRVCTARGPLRTRSTRRGGTLVRARRGWRRRVVCGQHETLLNVKGVDALRAAVGMCLESLYAERALAYREKRGVSNDAAQLAVLVQLLVPADASAVVFSANPITGRADEAVVTASWGLGESIVGGTVSPDTYIVDKETPRIVQQQVGSKLRMTIPIEGGTREVDVPPGQRALPAISDEQCIAAVDLARALEREMGWAVDVECAWSANSLFLLQCRPITTLLGAGRQVSVCRPPARDKTVT